MRTIFGFRRKIWRRDPLRSVDGIPIFSGEDRYTENYKKIAHDHVTAIQAGVENPFMDAALWRSLEDSTRDLITKYVKPRSSILDVGVGLGRLLGPLQLYERHGIDISLDYLRRAKAAGIDVAFARIEDMPYCDEVFDVAVCCDVLEHVLNLHRSTEEILRVVKPEGLLIVRVPFKEQLDGYLDPANPYEFVHLRNFDLQSLKLHFTRIFPCDWMAHSFVAPYLANPTRLRLRTLPSQSPLRDLIKELPRLAHPLSPLTQLCAVSEEEILEWMRELQERHPHEFAKIVDELVIPLEVNVVLQKRLPA